MSYRTTFIDYDSRRQPKTDRFCIRCQKDIKPQSPARVVHVVDGGINALHPEDEDKYANTADRAGDQGSFLIGMDCARKLGMEWTRPA